MNKNHILITVAFVIVSFVLGYKFDSITGKHSKHAENALQRPRVAMFPFNIQPNDSQKKELERIDDKYADKIMNARNAMANIITPDQRKARMEAAQKAQKEGKKGKDFMDAIQQSMHMTPDQEKKMKDTQTELIDLSKQMQEEIQKLLTEDQKKEMNDRIKALSQNRPVPMPGGSLQPRTPGKQAAGKPEPKTEKTPAAHGKKKS
jgi:Spy/CpxP family protein refolding chaperone